MSEMTQEQVAQEIKRLVGQLNDKAVLAHAMGLEVSIEEMDMYIMNGGSVPTLIVKVSKVL